jgi:hypothetical protein
MRSESETKLELDRAISVLRSTDVSSEAGGLSGATRAAILEQMAAPGARLRRIPNLFVPGLKWAVAAGPLLVLVLAVGWISSSDRSPVTATHVQVSKAGDEVVFVIANGDRVHRVSTSERPDRFERRGAVVRAEEPFVDRLYSDADIVFYRID